MGRAQSLQVTYNRSMIRRVFLIASLVGFAGLAGLLGLSCKNAGDGATGEGGAPVAKLYCKMNNQCWICPNDEAMKKCLHNPVTSGCKLGGASDCP